MCLKDFYSSTLHLIHVFQSALCLKIYYKLQRQEIAKEGGEEQKMAAIFLKILFSLLLLKNATSTSFSYTGLGSANLSLNGFAAVEPNGLLQLTNFTPQCKGHAFYPQPLHLRRQGRIFSFSTTFVFGIVTEYPDVGSMGMAFFISPSKQLPSGPEARFLGIFNSSNIGNLSNHILSIELSDVTGNIGVDVNGADRLFSKKSVRAAYYGNGSMSNLTITGGEPMQVWVDYHGGNMQLSVTISPLSMLMKPNRPLLSSKINLTDVILDDMYVGFSAASGNAPTSHCILGWSFNMNGISPPIDHSSLPELPRRLTTTPKQKSPVLAIVLPLISLPVLVIVIAAIVLVVRRKAKFAEVLEDWERQYGPHRFSYKDLFRATNGFNDKELLGQGGFGSVYKGVLQTSKAQIAVKKISHGSRQGIREFVAEIASIGQLRHRNLVQLLGYCRRKGELLLVYEFMPNGSLDRRLFGEVDASLDWYQRLHIIKGVASGLLYLHEEWEQIVIHRDVKASNVLLDGELNARLGDFGLARLYDHGTGPQTTHVVGTLGYIAPEMARTGKATKETDVFAFGLFLLEVVCGKTPIGREAQRDELIILVDWVLKNWIGGSFLDSVDPKLGKCYVVDEVEMVLKLGLLCSHSSENLRPSMRQVVQFLDGNSTLPEFSPEYVNPNLGLTSLEKYRDFNDYVVRSTGGSSSVNGTGSIFISGGR